MNKLGRNWKHLQKKLGWYRKESEREGTYGRNFLGREWEGAWKEMGKNQGRFLWQELGKNLWKKPRKKW